MTRAHYIIQSLPQKWSMLLSWMVWPWLFLDIPESIKTELTLVAGIALLLMLRESFSGIRVYLGSGRVTDSAPGISKEEKIREVGHALLSTGLEHIPGQLSLTHERLVFLPHNDSRTDEVVNIRTQDIQSVQPEQTRLFGLIPLGRLSLAVATHTGHKHTFSVHNPQYWLAQPSR